MKQLEGHDVVTLVVDIVSAFVSNNTVHASDLSQIIEVVHGALTTIVSPKPEPAPSVQVPAVPIKRSITDEYLVCLEDGKRFKSLKRHLQQAFGQSPDDYRTKWGLPRDYPMVAPGYAAKRSQLAKESGLGSDRRKALIAAPATAQPPLVAPPEVVDVVAAPKRKRARPRAKAEPA